MIFKNLYFEKKNLQPPQKILDKEDVGNSGLMSNSLDNRPSSSWLLAVDNIPSSQLCSHNALILYDFEPSFSNS